MFFKFNKPYPLRLRWPPNDLSLYEFRKASYTSVTWLLGLLALAMAPILQAQTVLTVRDAEYRSRWAGKQEDRLATPQYFAPGGGLDEEAAGATSTEDPIEPGLVESMDRMAENVKRGLRFGPLDFQLGLSNGWEYSSQNSAGGSNDFADNNSFFAAPTIGITYEREIGVWTVNARFGTGYRYYFNQDYTAAGTGAQRNPLALTGGIDIGYNTSRLSVNLSGSASSGISSAVSARSRAASSALSRTRRSRPTCSPAPRSSCSTCPDSAYASGSTSTSARRQRQPEPEHHSILCSTKSDKSNVYLFLTTTSSYYLEET
jgi:hypothetical protein